MPNRQISPNRVGLAAVLWAIIPAIGLAQGEALAPDPSNPTGIGWGLLNMGGLGLFSFVVWQELRAMRNTREDEQARLKELIDGFTAASQANGKKLVEIRTMVSERLPRKGSDT